MQPCVVVCLMFMHCIMSCFPVDPVTVERLNKKVEAPTSLRLQSAAMSMGVFPRRFLMRQMWQAALARL